MKEEENQDKNDSLYEPENTYGMTVDQADTARRRGAKLKAILNLSGETAVIGYDDDSVYIHAHGQSEPTYMSYTEAEALAKMLLSAAEELRLDIGGN